MLRTLPFSMIETLLQGVGAVVIAAALLYLVYVVLQIHILSGRPLTAYGANPKMRGAGSWAVVTLSLIHI